MALSLQSVLGASAGIAVPALIGAACAVVLVLASEIGIVVALAVILAIPTMVVACLRPRIGVLILLLTMFAIEEFAGALDGESAERSLRTPLYSVAVGAPGVYLPDVMIVGVLLIYLVHTILAKARLPLRVDMISIALFMVGTTVAISVVLSYMGPDPLGPLVLDLSTVGSVTLYELIARLIGVLQLKLFAVIFPAYVIGLFYFREKRDLEHFLLALLIAMIFSCGVAGFRLLRDPSLVTGLVPVIYDTATVWFMAMTVFYAIGMWAIGRLSVNTTVVYVVFSIILMLFILLSFRRTLWGAIFLATLVFPFVLPRKGRGRFFALAACAVLIGGAVLGATGPGRAVLFSVLERLGETNFANPSTLYRFSLLVYVVQEFFNLPVFGFGITPLWNETVHLRLFKSSMENIHSLYFWILLRFGIIGSLVFTCALGLVFAKCIREYRRLKDDRYKLLVGIIVLAILMFMVDGIFNPVYARVRNLIPLGFALAMLSRLPYIVGPQSQTSNPEARVDKVGGGQR